VIEGRRLDALLGVGAAAIVFVFVFWGVDSSMGLASSVVVASLSGLAVAISGGRPMVGLGVVAVVAVLTPAFALTFEALPLVVGLVGFRTAQSGKVPPLLIGSVCVTALMVVDVWQRENLGTTYREPSILLPMLFGGLTVGLGAVTARLARQNHELRALRDVDRLRAVSEERRRIARDIHDVAAHHLSALVVRSKLALRSDDTDTHRQAVAFAASTSQEALDSIRQVVSVLSTRSEAPLEPQPGLADLDAVIDRANDGGLTVDRAIALDGVTADAQVQLAVVRIAQEALANVLRHRGPGRAWLSLSAYPTTLSLQVDDDGPDTWRPESADPGLLRSGSSGIVGMRERAEACDGRLFVGPSPRGGWRVSAVLPAAPSESRASTIHREVDATATPS
jgi:signal transduction histidine kinase